MPLVRVIVRDVTELAQRTCASATNVCRASFPGKRSGLSEAHQEEMLQAQREVERGQERMRDYERELQQLGIELKDYFTGLIDFPCWMDGREVYLCWRLGEPEVGLLARTGRRLRRPAEIADAARAVAERSFSRDSGGLTRRTRRGRIA